MQFFATSLSSGRIVGFVAALILVGFSAYAAHSYVTKSRATDVTTENPIMVGVDSGQRETITLAGGCFWCSEAFFQEADGVVGAVSGYAGGTTETATYAQVSRGDTGHREAVAVTYDPARISLSSILNIYWSHIDPTDGTGQFSDKGFQYTTAIFYHTDAQKAAAEASKVALIDSGVFEEVIVTEILPYTTFFRAEEYHQDYYQKSSLHYELYKKASGRTGFIEENWAKEAALEFLKEEEEGNESVPAPASPSVMYAPRDYTSAEIESGLKKLSSEAYKVVAEEGTEPAYRNAYWDNKAAGIYVDVVTGRPLFSSEHKYDSKTGWPSFYEPLSEANLTLKTDNILGFERTEVRSEAGHLGHVFDDGPAEYGGKRYCMNSLALRFIPKEEMAAQGYGAYLALFRV
jgi:peptide methionine sulfoxide reductase msrA/msrB